MKTLLIAKSAVEIGAGLAFALFPSAVFFLLFGEHSDSRLLIRAGYIIGIALVTLGIACWLSRNDSRSHAASGLIVALLIYDAGFVFILVSAYFGTGVSGLLLWPVAALHSGLAICSVLCLKKELSPARSG